MQHQELIKHDAFSAKRLAFAALHPRHKFCILAACGLSVAACERGDPEAVYRAELKACSDMFEATGSLCGPDRVPMLTRSGKAEELAKMGGHADQDDIRVGPEHSPEPAREIKESFMAYYNMPFGTEGEREAWIRFLRAMDRADAELKGET